MMMYEREDINEILLNNARAMLHRNEKNNGGENRKLEKEKERIKKKERRTHPSSLSSPGGSFRFRFNDVLFFVRVTPIMFLFLLFIVVIIVVILLCGVLCVFHNQNRLKNEKIEKKSFGEMSIFKPSSSLYIIHNAREERLRD
jgi:Flp pilus assembly protein TadB